MIAFLAELIAIGFVYGVMYAVIIVVQTWREMHRGRCEEQRR